MTQQSLLASLSSEFRDKPENIVTTALAHILGRTQVARDVLTAQAFLGADAIPSVSMYRSQVQDGSTRPDLAGFDENGNEIALIEAKFWAGLTEQQPNGYLARLDNSDASALCFVVPEARRASLWSEVLGKAAEQFSPGDWAESGTYSKRIRSNLVITIISWQGLLHSMIEATSAVGDHKTAHDIEQLASYCEYLEQEGFIPLRSEDLGPSTPRLLGQLISAVDHVIDNGKALGKYSTKGFNPSSARERFTRYFESRGIRLALSLHHGFWIKYSVSPVWLQFQGGTSGPEHQAFLAARDEFHGYETASSRRMFIIDDGSPIFAIRLPMGVDLDSVVEDVFDQIDEIVEIVTKV